MLEPYHWVPREEDAVVGEPVRLQLERRRRETRRQAPRDVGAVLLQPLLGFSGGEKDQRRLRAEADVVVQAVAGGGDVDAVVLPVDRLALPRQPCHVAELVEVTPHGQLLRHVLVVAGHELHRPLELRLQLKSDLHCMHSAHIVYQYIMHA